MALGTAIIILALPWTYALVQHPRKPFVLGALVGGTVGAVIMGVVVGELDFLSAEFGVARSAAAVLVMGGPLGTLLGQAVVALFVPPRPRNAGALVGWLIGPIWGWPLLFMFPADDPALWHGSYWLVFWIGSWAGWAALNGAYLGVWSQTWDPVGRRLGKLVLVVLTLPALAIGAWNFDHIMLHVTRVDDLARRHDTAGIVWKMDRGEELARAVAFAGEAAEGMDPAMEARLLAVLDGTFAPMVGQARSEAEYREARVSAARSLGRIGDTDSLNALLKHADDRDEPVRKAVIEGLGRSRRPEARATIRKAAQTDPDPDVRATARAALATP